MQASRRSAPGLTCLQHAFPKSWRSVENVARSLGIQLTYAEGSHPWVFVPSDSIGDILATQSRRAEEVAESRFITRDHVSNRVLKGFIGFD